MSTKHRRTIKAIFKVPVPSGVKGNDIESLFVYLGGELSEDRSSRIRVDLNGVKAVFHRPHPKPDTDEGALVSVRRSLENVGIDDESL
jgi:hypothetical protein